MAVTLLVCYSLLIYITLKFGDGTEKLKLFIDENDDAILNINGKNVDLSKLSKFL